MTQSLYCKDHSVRSWDRRLHVLFRDAYPLRLVSEIPLLPRGYRQFSTCLGQKAKSLQSNCKDVNIRIILDNKAGKEFKERVKYIELYQKERWPLESHSLLRRCVQKL